MKRVRLFAVLAAVVALVPLVVSSVADSATVGTTFTVADAAGTNNFFPSIAFNPATGQSLVVWAGCTTACPTTDEQVQGQLINGDGSKSGGQIGISVELPSLGHDQLEPPFVTYNSTANEWLVLWTDDVIVYAQRISATGTRLGANFVVNDGTVDLGDPTVVDETWDDIEQVEAAWSPQDQVYLVAWKGTLENHDIPSIVEQQIWATILGADGTNLNSGAGFLVSNTTNGANDGVSVTYSTVSDVWLVAWKDDVSNEAWGRILSYPPTAGGAVPPSSPGTDFGAASFQIGNSAGEVKGGAPGVGYDPSRDRFLVLWPGTQGTDAAGFTDLANNEQEIFGRFVNGAGSVLDATDHRFTDVPDDAGNLGVPNRPLLDYDPAGDRFMVVAHARGYPDGPTLSQFEVWAQQVTGAGAPDGPLTRATTTAALFATVRPDVAFIGQGCFQAVWYVTDAREDGGTVQELFGTIDGALLGCNAFVVPIQVPSFTG